MEEKRLYFYKLKSHQDSLLVDHLKFVGDRGAILIENNQLILNIVKVNYNIQPR